MRPSIAPTILLILDGWGQAPAGPANAVSLAKTPHLDRISKKASKTLLKCSGRSVGLPEGFMGNSEVGHINIGAGRVVFQDMTRIDLAIEDGSIKENICLVDLLDSAKKNNGRVHFMGLLSNGGVHSHTRHLYTLLNLAHEKGVKSIVHPFMDGRDSAPDSGLPNIKELQEKMPDSASIGTICGRYYAMDRDKRWDRTVLAFDLLTKGQGKLEKDPVQAVENSYKADITDEFIKPTVIEGYDGFREGDAIFMFNFRADRMRQLAHAFYDKDFSFFPIDELPSLSAIASMTLYEANLNFPIAFARESLVNGMGETVAKYGLRQLRVAETEKYAHVTFFFNGGEEKTLEGETRKLIPSPRDVATYDLKPEMSAEKVTDTLLEELDSGKHDFIVCNLANMDMVGHTGSIPAAIKACETVDHCVGRIEKSLMDKKGILLITADHGNAEDMLSPNGAPQTAHSTNPVALLLLGQGTEKLEMQAGVLGDISPTILDLWNIDKPKEMTGKTLIKK